MHSYERSRSNLRRATSIRRAFGILQGELRVYRGDFAIRAEANGGPSCLQCHYCNLFGQPAARRAERAAHHFWRLPKGPQEGPAHTLSIREPDLARDRIDGMPTLFEHQPRGI